MARRQVSQSTRISKVKLFSVEAGILNAFAKTGIEVMVGIGNDKMKPLSSLAAAQQWVQANVAPFMPATNIRYLSVGNEVLSSSEMIYDLQFAMQNLYTACQQAGFSTIKFTTPHSMGLLQSSVLPSNGTFGAGPAAILSPILSFLAKTGSPFMANAYPFFGYLGQPNSTNLQYALFNSSIQHYDNVTKLTYYNMFDAQGASMGTTTSKGSTTKHWCVAKTGANASDVQAAMDWTCTQAGIDCKPAMLPAQHLAVSCIVCHEHLLLEPTMHAELSSIHKRLPPRRTHLLCREA